jgi:hypothetical protein
LGGSSYRLSNLLRGQRGTDTQTAGHSAGDVFLLYNSAVKRFDPPGGDWIGQDISLKVVGVGKPEFGTPDDTATIEVCGDEILPYSVCKIEGARDGSNNLTVTWHRRTRAQGEWADLSDVPLNEYDERYEVRIYDVAETTLLRTISATAETADYLAADQTTDGLTPGDPVHLKVVQIGHWPMNFGGGGGFDIDGYTRFQTV